MRTPARFFFLLFTIITANIFSQIVPPYAQYFDSVNCIGWTHAATTGNDDWQRGVPAKMTMNQPSSPPNVWATNLTGITSANSIMYLQTPGFDLSNMTKVYVLSFEHKLITASYHGGNVEYSTDGGATWNLLNGTSTQKINWYNNASCSGLSGKPTWSGYMAGSYMYSAHSLVALQGQPNVIFRFYYGGLTNPLEGWMIDNFRITENIPDVIGLPGTQCNITKFFPTYTVTSTLLYTSLGPPTFSNVTNYYFSNDSVLDPGDVFVGSKSQNINSTLSPWTATFTTPPNLNARDYYIFYKHDFANNLAELDENNNVGCVVLHVDSTFNVPSVKDDFEGAKDWWKPVGYNTYFTKGKSSVHQIEGNHSGQNSWYIKAPKYSSTGTFTSSIESPFMDFTAVNNNVICFWYRAKNTYTSNPSKLKLEASPTFTQGYTYTITIPFPRFTDWDCNCQDLWMFNGKNNGRLRFTHQDGMTYAMFNQSINFDDIFVGQPTPDYTIEHKNILSTPTTVNSDTLYYDFFNAGYPSAPASSTEFYWSNDSLLDPGDILLGTVSEATLAGQGFRKEKFIYTKPTTAQGTYFIIYKLDAASLVSEMWENNNTGYYKLKQDPLVALPYNNDFETQSNGWWHYASIGSDNWQLGVPTGTILTSAFSGSVCFNTTQYAALSPMSRSHLYTPIFDFTTITDPVMEFDMKLNSNQSCHCFEGKMNMSYSTDGGASWIVLDTLNDSYTRWYYPMDYDDWGGIDKVYYIPNYTELLIAGTERSFAAYDQYNSRDADRTTRYVIDLKQFVGKPHVQFRFNIASAQNDTTSNPLYTLMQGAVIDNFKIRTAFTDLMVPYKKSLMISGLSSKIKFNMWIKNNSNYKTAPSVNRYYVSADTILDPSDFNLGTDTIKGIRPDMKSYINRAFNGPAVLTNYKYLIYELDIANTNTESNESNNIGYWPLALDSVSTYPYYQTFSDSILNGWHEYEINPYYSTIMQNQWRFRHMVAPAEYLYQSQIKSGQAFTDRYNGANSITGTPYWYFETPSFDFTNYNSLQMKFDLAVWGNSQSGGNMEYSLNGGNTWSVLQPTISSMAYNWYNSSSIMYLGNVPGWTLLVKPVTVTDSVWFNINFLSGQPNVVFRFKFRSNANPSGSGYPHGMRIDNFWIKGNAIGMSVTEQLKGFTNMYNFEDQLFINYGELNDVNNHYTVTLTNMLGQKVFSVPIDLQRGANMLTLPEHLSNGMYLVNLSNSRNNSQQKILLMK